MKNKVLAVILGLVVVFSLTACGSGSPDQSGKEDSGKQDLAEIVTDEAAGTVTISAQVNGMFFDQSTMHYIVNKDGGQGDNCMLAAYCDSQDFYDALESVGGKPWNTTSDKIADGEFTDGQKVDITLTWDGQDEPVEMVDTVKADKGAFDVDMRFSGNKDNNAECGSGCIACLNSCWAGITSNAAYGFGAIDGGSPKVFLNDSVMPEDGTVVQITFTLK